MFRSAGILIRGESIHNLFTIDCDTALAGGIDRHLKEQGSFVALSALRTRSAACCY
jgi:hypothetical protein